MRRSRATRLLLVRMASLVLVAAMTLPGVSAVAQEPPPLVGELRLTDDPTEPDRSFVFWAGGEVGDDPQHSLPLVGDPGVSTCDNSPCFRYRLAVASAGRRLRVAIDTPARNDNFFTQVTPPGGTPVSVRNANAFNAEIFIADPPVGTYDILVRPYSASSTRFQMRAKLEAVPFVHQPNEDGFLLPNLRPSAPYDLSFIAPANPGAGIAPDDLNPELDVAGVHPLSCSWDETLHDQDIRCLRFGFGLVNAGEGNFDLRWRGIGFGLPPEPILEGPTFQCVQRADGPPVAREAGFFKFHETHGHVHQEDIIYTELYKVTDPVRGRMWAAGEGRKLGYFPADQAFADWDRFVQSPVGTSGSAGNCVPDANQRIGMSVGWGDVYRWQRPGNYVDFGTNTDGLYVVRLTVDPFDRILESNEADNTGYTYVRVTGDRVEVLQYGRGASPWDPDRKILGPRIQGGVPW